MNHSINLYRTCSPTNWTVYSWLSAFIFALSLHTPNVFAEQIVTSNRFDIEFVTIPAGDFKMGSTNNDRELALKEMLMQNQKRHDMNNYRDEYPQHDVTITRSFLLGRTEITQGQWLKIMENRPGPDEYWQRHDWQVLPVVSISWNMANPHFSQSQAQGGFWSRFEA